MQAGLVDTYRRPISNRQPVAWTCSAALILIYVFLYFGDLASSDEVVATR